MFFAYENHTINFDATIHNALNVLNKLRDRKMLLFVLDNEQRLWGTLTDGDIRRAFLKGFVLSDTVKDIAFREFKFLSKNGTHVQAISAFRKMGLSLLPVLDDDGRIVAVHDISDGKSILPLDAVIMAGGKGERLRPLTNNTPKPLLPIAGKSIIDYNIEALMRNGITNINVTVNYLKEQLAEHFSRPFNGIQVKCVEEPRFLGTAGAMRFVKDFENDAILLMNSDIFTNICYEDFYLYFAETQADMAVATLPYSISVPYGIVDLDGEKVQGLSEKPTFTYYANAGIYLLKRQMVDLIPTNEVFNATDLMNSIIDKGLKVVHYPIGGYWIDIGNKDEYKKAQEMAKFIAQ